jgi:hypothetical protein
LGSIALLSMVVGRTPVQADSSAPTFHRVATFQHCVGTARCSVARRADLKGAFTLTAGLVSPDRGRRPGNGIADTSADFDTSEFVPGPSGRIDIIARVKLRDVSITRTASNNGYQYGAVSIEVSSPDCPDGCPAQAGVTVGDLDKWLFVKASMVNPYYRDISSRRLNIRVTASVRSELWGDAGRTQVRLRALSTSVEVVREPPARHVYTSARFSGGNGVVENGPVDPCLAVAGNGISGACFFPPTDAGAISARVSSDLPAESSTRIQLLDSHGRVLRTSISPCGSPANEYLNPIVARVVVQPVPYTGCPGPPPSGTISADFTIPPL